MIVCFGVAFMLSILLRLFLIWENKRRDNRTGTITDLDDDQIGAMNLSDATDKEMANFRYVC